MAHDVCTRVLTGVKITIRDIRTGTITKKVLAQLSSPPQSSTSPIAPTTKTARE